MAKKILAKKIEEIVSAVSLKNAHLSPQTDTSAVRTSL